MSSVDWQTFHQILKAPESHFQPGLMWSCIPNYAIPIGYFQRIKIFFEDPTEGIEPLGFNTEQSTKRTRQCLAFAHFWRKKERVIALGNLRYCPASWDCFGTSVTLSFNALHVLKPRGSMSSMCPHVSLEKFSYFCQIQFLDYIENNLKKEKNS